MGHYTILGHTVEPNQFILFILDKYTKSTENLIPTPNHTQIGRLVKNSLTCSRKLNQIILDIDTQNQQKL